MLYVFFLNLPLQFPHTSSVLGSEKDPSEFQNIVVNKPSFENHFQKSIRCLPPEIILDIEGDPHVGGLPLYVELVAGLQAKQDCGVKVCMYCKAKCLFLSMFPSKCPKCKLKTPVQRVRDEKRG